MSKVLLLNSAVMPASDGIYMSCAISLEEFVSEVKQAFLASTLISHVGYTETALVIQQACGVPIEVNRRAAEVSDGDVILVAKLKDRVVDPMVKGKVLPTIEDFEFRFVSYKESNGTSII